MPSTKTIALFPDESTARENKGYYCPANLPRPGERVEVEGRTATVVANTPAAQPSFETDCTVQVQYTDGSLDTVSAAEQPTPRWVQAGELGFCAAYFAPLLSAVTGGFGDGNAWPKAQKRHQEVLEDLEVALAKSKETTPPTSGEYWGGSEESDGADQSVRSTIRFGSDGSISGLMEWRHTVPSSASAADVDDDVLFEAMQLPSVTFVFSKRKDAAAPGGEPDAEELETSVTDDESLASSVE